MQVARTYLSYAVFLIALFLGAFSTLHVFSTKKNEREVLSTLMYVGHPNELYKVIKIRSGQDILIEVYSNVDSQLISSFKLEKKKDLFYDFKSSVTNMLMANVDEDDSQEILVPVMGADLEASIHVLKFSKENRQFALF